MDSVNCAVRWSSVPVIKLLKFVVNCSRGPAILKRKFVSHGQWNDTLIKTAKLELSNGDSLTSLRMISETNKKKKRKCIVPFETPCISVCVYPINDLIIITEQIFIGKVNIRNKYNSQKNMLLKHL